MIGYSTLDIVKYKRYLLTNSCSLTGCHGDRGCHGDYLFLERPGTLVVGRLAEVNTK